MIIPYGNVYRYILCDLGTNWRNRPVIWIYLQYSSIVYNLLLILISTPIRSMVFFRQICHWSSSNMIMAKQVLVVFNWWRYSQKTTTCLLQPLVYYSTSQVEINSKSPLAFSFVSSCAAASFFKCFTFTGRQWILNTVPLSWSPAMAWSAVC